MITFQFRLHLPLVFLVFLQQNRTDNFDKDLSVLRLKKRCPSCWKTKWRSFSSLDVTGLASAFDNRYLEFVLHLWLYRQSFFRYFCANCCERKVRAHSCIFQKPRSRCTVLPQESRSNLISSFCVSSLLSSHIRSLLTDQPGE